MFSLFGLFGVFFFFLQLFVHKVTACSRLSATDSFLHFIIIIIFTSEYFFFSNTFLFFCFSLVNESMRESHWILLFFSASLLLFRINAVIEHQSDCETTIIYSISVLCFYFVCAFDEKKTTTTTYNVLVRRIHQLNIMNQHRTLYGWILAFWCFVCSKYFYEKYQKKFAVFLFLLFVTDNSTPNDKHKRLKRNMLWFWLWIS